MKPSVYNSPDVKRQVIETTNRFRGYIEGPIQDHYISTSFGESHVMESGDRSQRTIVVLHGGMTNHAFILFFLRELVGRYHILCPDYPGHAGFSTEERIDPRGDDFGQWLVELLDCFGVEEADFVGTSYGGFVTTRVIALAPERVRSAVLIVPGGIVGMSKLDLMRHILIRLVAYQLTGRERFFRKVMDALFTDYASEDVQDFFRLTLTGMTMDTRPMKLLDVDECSAFEKPVHVIAAEHDVIFNCAALKKRVGELFPHASIDVLVGSKHSPSITDRGIHDLNTRVIRFLEQHAG